MERDEQVAAHLEERRSLQAKLDQLTDKHRAERKRLFGLVADYLGSPSQARQQARERSRDSQLSLSL